VRLDRLPRHSDRARNVPGSLGRDHFAETGNVDISQDRPLVINPLLFGLHILLATILT